jgi:hypothetical protein
LWSEKSLLNTFIDVAVDLNYIALGALEGAVRYCLRINLGVSLPQLQMLIGAEQIDQQKSCY